MSETLYWILNAYIAILSFWIGYLLVRLIHTKEELALECRKHQHTLNRLHAKNVTRPLPSRTLDYMEGSFSDF